MSEDRLNILLKQLKLTTILKHYKAFAKEATQNSHSYETFLKALCEEEVNQRTQNAIKRLIARAKFDHIKLLSEYHFTEQPQLNKQHIMSLADGHFVDEARNVCMMGPSGLGKSHLATAIAYEACKKKYATLFLMASKLVNQLIEANRNHTLSKLQKQLAKYKLIVLDELGYIPFSKEGAQHLFQFFSDRYEKASIIVTTNLDFGDWTSFMGDETMTGALLDRFTHHCDIFTFQGESFRFKQSKKAKEKQKKT
jgi:DNA replication protein DnaC